MTNIGNIGVSEECRAFEQCKQHIYIGHVIDETYCRYVTSSSYHS